MASERLNADGVTLILSSILGSCLHRWILSALKLINWYYILHIH